ncbi:MAG: polyribonucleotide nucleotidyltransferase [Bradymonadales bacterium]|nr:polyribonucleotide nucleotidyltransferase [Bradymonadales bacterium]
MARETVLIDPLPISFEVGYWAAQASQSVVISAKDGFLLVALTAEQEPQSTGDFLPLTVEYRERFSAAGKIPGSYDRREGRPSLGEILTSRLIDRTIRPLFPQAYRAETQVMATLFSSDPEVDLPVLAITGASLALMLSDIPWEGPVAAVRVGRCDGRFLLFPSPEQRQESDLDFVISVGANGVVMVEGESRQVSETDLVQCLRFAEQGAQPLLQMQTRWADRMRLEKRKLSPIPALPEVVMEAIDGIDEEIRQALVKPNKKAREKARRELQAHAMEHCRAIIGTASAELEPTIEKTLQQAFHRVGRSLILMGTRFDGRSHTAVRPIDCRVRVLPSCHGSAVFTRGETQALASCTLAGPRDTLRQETLSGQEERRFFLHYNFPPFSVGETRPLRSPGRREIGHGNLASRAFHAVLPEPGRFPYTMRVVSDILSSNGSSSMASVCAGCLALLDAGVPLASSVAGVAMGLVKQGDEIAILTDILGDEDHLGDMDFKVCGTRKGITAVQMDLKVEGLTDEILGRALEQARRARLSILDAMEAVLPTARPNVSPHANQVILLHIRPERIGDLIGSSGRTIRGIIDSTGAQIDVENDGSVRIAAPQESALTAARKKVLEVVREPRLGEIYTGTVLRLFPSQALVEIMPGTEGFLPISQADSGYVSRLEDLFSPGDNCLVKVIGVDDRGRILLSRKEIAGSARVD